jgi:hypothetical protein
VAAETASKEQEEETVAAVYDRRPDDDGGHKTPLQGDDSIPAGPTPEEEAALLTTDRSSEQFYGLLPQIEQGDAEPVAASLPPMEDLVKRIPVPTRALIEELFRARFITVKRVPTSALKN